MVVYYSTRRAATGDETTKRINSQTTTTILRGHCHSRLLLLLELERNNIKIYRLSRQSIVEKERECFAE